MHLHVVDHPFTHSHAFVDEGQIRSERRTRIVVALTAGMMVVEIAAGIMFGSMALLADGFHMASHVAALGLAAGAYAFARRHAASRRYSFGTGKVVSLAGYTSAVILGLIAVLMGYESIGRMVAPQAIDFGSAILVAIVGLAVNVASALLLDDDHGGHHEHDSGARHRDHNLRAAYVHVVADALTSVLAVVALTAGYFLGWSWLDSVMGLVGAGVILWWSYGLLRASAETLLDAEPSRTTSEAIRRTIEGADDNRVTDLHLWRVGPHHLAAIVALTTHEPRPPAHYKALLAGIGELAHVTVEVEPCPGESCRAA